MKRIYEKFDLEKLMKLKSQYEAECKNIDTKLEHLDARAKIFANPSDQFAKFRKRLMNDILAILSIFTLAELVVTMLLFPKTIIATIISCLSIGGLTFVEILSICNLYACYKKEDNELSNSVAEDDKDNELVNIVESIEMLRQNEKSYQEQLNLISEVIESKTVRTGEVTPVEPVINLEPSKPSTLSRNRNL